VSLPEAEEFAAERAGGMYPAGEEGARGETGDGDYGAEADAGGYEEAGETVEEEVRHGWGSKGWEYWDSGRQSGEGGGGVGEDGV